MGTGFSKVEERLTYPLKKKKKIWNAFLPGSHFLRLENLVPAHNCLSAWLSVKCHRWHHLLSPLRTGNSLPDINDTCSIAPHPSVLSGRVITLNLVSWRKVGSSAIIVTHLILSHPLCAKARTCLLIATITKVCRDLKTMPGTTQQRGRWRLVHGTVGPSFLDGRRAGCLRLRTFLSHFPSEDAWRCKWQEPLRPSLSDTRKKEHLVGCR